MQKQILNNELLNNDVSKAELNILIKNRLRLLHDIHEDLLTYKRNTRIHYPHNRKVLHNIQTFVRLQKKSLSKL